MKLPQFIYTRRWLVIMGLSVTLACMMGLLVYISIQKSVHRENKSASTNNSTEQSTESTPSATKKTTSEIALGSTASSKLTESAKATMLEVKTALEAKDGQKLYDLLGSEMKAIFTVESVASAFAQADGITITQVEELRINNEWAKQDVQSVDAAGNKQNFRVVLHLEGGAWKLYGTEKLG